MSQTVTHSPATLKAEPRTRLGSRPANQLRRAGRIPASIEWLGHDPHVDLSIDEDAFMTARRHHQHVYAIELGGKQETAIVRHLDWDVFGDRILHVEFRRVDLTKKTEVEVDISFTGHPKGQLNQLVTHVTVRALPTEIPDTLEALVADLEPGATVTAGQLQLPAGVELVTPPQVTVARISEIKIEVIAAPTPVEGAEVVEGAVPAAGAVPGAPAAGGAAPAKGAAPAAAEPKKDDKKKK